MFFFRVEKDKKKKAERNRCAAIGFSRTMFTDYCNKIKQVHRIFRDEMHRPCGWNPARMMRLSFVQVHFANVTFRLL